MVATVTTDTDTVSNYAIQARCQSRNPLAKRNFQKTYQGVTHVNETELQDNSSESEDDIPVSTLLRKEKIATLTEQQTKDCLEGPQGERAIGVSVCVAKLFGGLSSRAQ